MMITRCTLVLSHEQHGERRWVTGMDVGQAWLEERYNRRHDDNKLETNLLGYYVQTSVLANLLPIQLFVNVFDVTFVTLLQLHNNAKLL